MHRNGSLIVALDVPTLDEALGIVNALKGLCGTFSIGPELACAEGLPRVVWAIHNDGGEVIIDLKLHDIPSTVARTVGALARLQPKAFTIHACGGATMVRAATNTCGSAMVFGTSVLTSHDDARCTAQFGADVHQKVHRHALVLDGNGAHGIICAASEVAMLRADPDLDDLAIIATGVRPNWMAHGDDHARSATPYEAISNGATAVIIGRPIINPPDGMSRVDATSAIIEELTKGQLAAPSGREGQDVHGR